MCLPSLSRWLCLLAASMSVLVSIGAGAPHSGRLPNVVLILVDDIGYGDVAPFAEKRYSTPHLDELAKRGRVFTDFYVTQAVCSASRAGLLTGCYSNRVGIGGALKPWDTHGIHERETTLAEIFRQKGYATACFGKWHLGHHRKFLPLQHGFDEYFGLPYSNDMWPFHASRPDLFSVLPLIEGNHVAKPAVTAADQKMLTTWYTERAVAFIAKRKERPFFLYLPHSMAHVPLFVSDKFAGASKHGLYGDVMMEIDWSVGEVLGAIEKHGLENGTLLIFLSDNGPWLAYGNHAGSAGVLREGKFTVFEGGCRVPAVMMWPGVIPAGSKTSVPVVAIDILPTVAKLIGAKLPKHKIDGKDIWPVIRGDEEARSPHEAIYFYYGQELQAIRMGRWKMHFPHRYPRLAGPPGMDGNEGRTERVKIGRSLFDLVTDPAETIDLKSDHPDVVARMEELAGKMHADLGDSALDITGGGVRPAGFATPR